MKTSKFSTRITLFTLFVALMISLVAYFSITPLFTIRETPYVVHTDGIVSTYEGGIAYRRPGHPIQLSLTGTHYEMGKQYGVLLRPEIQTFIQEEITELVNVLAEETGIPKRLLLYVFYKKSQPIYARLPQRFQEHLQGIADGSGVPLKNMMIFAAYGIVSEYEDTPDNCAGAVVRTADGGLFHGWNNDKDPGQYEAKYTVIVQHHPTGYHAYTNVNTLLSIDGGAAYNDAGLRVTENSLAAGRYEKGIHSGLLGRLIMEECQTLDDVAAVLNTYSPMTGTALLISDRNSGDAAVFDVVPNAQPTWGVTPLEHNALWAVNRFSDRRLAEDYQNNFLSQQSYNAARTRLFQAFFHDVDSRRYSLDDLIHAMQLRGNAKTETFRTLVDDSVCNVSTIKAIIHDAQGKGIYMAKGDGYFGAMAAWYFYPENIAEPPQLYKEAEPLTPELRDIGLLYSKITTSQEWAAQFQDLLRTYPDDAYLHFLAARMAFDVEDMERWQQHSLKAYQLNSHPEYQIEAAAVQLYRQNYTGTIALLKPMNVQENDSLEYQGRCLALLSKAYLSSGDETQSKHYWAELERILHNPGHVEELQKNFLDPLTRTTPEPKR